MLKLFADSFEVELKQWMFPAGEVGIKINTMVGWTCASEYKIVLQWDGNQDLFMQNTTNKHNMKL